MPTGEGKGGVLDLWKLAAHTQAPSSHVITGRDKIDYIFVSHTEPDHSFLVPAVLDLHPDAVVVGSKVCLQFLKGLTHRPFKEQAVKGGDKVGSWWAGRWGVAWVSTENAFPASVPYQVAPSEYFEPAWNLQVDLGGGHEIEFVMAPNLHWPDTMFSYDHGTGIMFTCDAFGMHYCSEVRGTQQHANMIHRPLISMSVAEYGLLRGLASSSARDTMCTCNV